MAAVGINMQELDEIIVDEDFASMLEQYEKKESEKVSQGEIVSIENGQVTSINEMSFHSNYRNLE